MMIKSLSNIDKTFSLVIEQERELHNSQSAISNSTGPEASTTLHLNTTFGSNSSIHGNNHFKGKTNGYGEVKGPNKVCTHCGRTNYTIETCFLKHEYPPGFRGKGKSTNSNSQSQFVASVETGQTSPKQNSSQSINSFTQEKYQSLLDLIQRSKTNPNANSISTSPFVLISRSHPENESF